MKKSGSVYTKCIYKARFDAKHSIALQASYESVFGQDGTAKKRNTRRFSTYPYNDPLDKKIAVFPTFPLFLHVECSVWRRTRQAQLFDLSSKWLVGCKPDLFLRFSNRFVVFQRIFQYVKFFAFTLFQRHMIFNL